ncbi:unnamed protein product [Periconia digitata]|uniref:Uncharacterized protein n=1 Tax=Periconia digitata TaxID=1303443 RepID=A0A9W4UK16_9PLEO|nr:unnamed protein product [Periconia digitata]
MLAKFFALTSFLALTSAFPTEQCPKDDEPPKPRKPKCAGGTLYFECANGYVGCFDRSPCAFPIKPVCENIPPDRKPPKNCDNAPWNFLLYKCQNGFAGCYPENPCGFPLGNHCVKAAETTAHHKIWEPRTWNVYPLVEAKDKSTLLDRTRHMETLKGEHQDVSTTSVMVFDNLPPNALNCKLQYSRYRLGRDQTKVEGDANIRVRQLTGWTDLPDTEIPTTEYRKFEDSSAPWSEPFDFTCKPFKIKQHIITPLKCAEQIAVEIKGSDQGTGKNQVFIPLENDTDGIYLSYDV